MTTPAPTMSQTIRLKSFDLEGHDIATADIGGLHALSIGVGWPHRPGDWDVLRSLGRGFVALDEIGRVFSSGMWFAHGEELATIGMMITSPRLQTYGGGRWMMERILDECGDRRLMLNSTRAAYQLYLSFGFQPSATVYQCQGYVSAGFAPEPGASEGVEPLAPSDLAEVTALDAIAFGAPRPRLLARFAETADLCGIRRAGRLTGFALRRPFGRGQVIGPVIAESEADAARLVAAQLAGTAGTFVRVDTRQPEGALRSLLLSAGVTLFDTVTTMTRGGPFVPVTPGVPGVYGLAAHALS